MTAFDAGQDTRYCAYVADLPHPWEIRQRIERIIHERRSELYCGIFFREA